MPNLCNALLILAAIVIVGLAVYAPWQAWRERRRSRANAERGRAALDAQRVAASNGPVSVRPRPDGPSTETDNPDFIDGHDWETSGFQSTVEVGRMIGKKRVTKFHSGPKNDWDY